MLALRTAIATLLVTLPSTALASDFMFEATYDGRLIEGRPVFWNDSEVMLLARDGVLHTVDPKKAENARRTSSSFEGYNSTEMRAELYKEFGDRFAITSTGHYLVLHPQEVTQDWAQQFENLYRAFHNYFRVRGFTPAEPKFPLVAIVYPTQDEYVNACRKLGHTPSPNALGHYDRISNRVMMFDRRDTSGDYWNSTLKTLVHEGTHQTAYNTGLHSRTAETPLWVGEGLATLFESPGVHGTGASGDRRQRVNTMRLADYREYLPTTGSTRELLELIASDEPFRTRTLSAYANAWALTFYLTETRPREYEQYLQKIAGRKARNEYPATARVRDFAEVFGKDFGLFESNFRTWMTELE